MMSELSLPLVPYHTPQHHPLYDFYSIRLAQAELEKNVFNGSLQYAYYDLTCNDSLSSRQGLTMYNWRVDVNGSWMAFTYYVRNAYSSSPLNKAPVLR